MKDLNMEIIVRDAVYVYSGWFVDSVNVSC